MSAGWRGRGSRDAGAACMAPDDMRRAQELPREELEKHPRYVACEAARTELEPNGGNGNITCQALKDFVLPRCLAIEVGLA